MAGLISAAELAQMQADATASMDLSVEIKRRGTSQGPTGNTIPTYSHLANTVCNLALPTAGQLANYGYVIGSLAAWQVRLPAGTDVTTTDYLIVSGQTLEVQVVLTPQSYPTAELVLASEIK